VFGVKDGLIARLDTIEGSMSPAGHEVTPGTALLAYPFVLPAKR
jgi:hydroxyquinol 1,2-dioxygenase